VLGMLPENKEFYLDFAMLEIELLYLEETSAFGAACFLQLNAC
jgi:hypothetical protein